MSCSVSEGIVFVERTILHQLRGSLSRAEPRAGAVNCFPVDAKPIAHSFQPVPGGLGDGAVRFRANVEEQEAVFAHAIYEPGDKFVDRFESQIADVAPAAAGINRCVRDPLRIGHLGFLAQLKIVDTCSGSHIVILIGDDDFLAAVGAPSK